MSEKDWTHDLGGPVPDTQPKRSGRKEMKQEIEYVGIAEVAEMAEVTPSAVCNWRERYDDFPDPIVDLHLGPVFDKKDITKWLTNREEKKRRRKK